MQNVRNEPREMYIKEKTQKKKNSGNILWERGGGRGGEEGALNLTKHSANVNATVKYIVKQLA